MTYPELGIRIIRAADRPRVHRQLPAGKNPLSYAYHALTDASLAGNLKAYFIEFQSGIREEIPLVNHQGEEFLFVLEGEIEFRSTQGNHRLKTGDSLHFDASIPHAFENPGKRLARALAVISTKT